MNLASMLPYTISFWRKYHCLLGRNWRYVAPRPPHNKTITEGHEITEPSEHLKVSLLVCSSDCVEDVLLKSIFNDGITNVHNNLHDWWWKQWIPRWCLSPEFECRVRTNYPSTINDIKILFKKPNSNLYFLILWVYFSKKDSWFAIILHLWNVVDISNSRNKNSKIWLIWY